MKLDSVVRGDEETEGGDGTVGEEGCVWAVLSSLVGV